MNTLLLTSIILILMLLTTPVLLPLFYNIKNINFTNYVTTSIKLSFIISIIPLTLFIASNTETIMYNIHWLTIDTMKISTSLKLDFFFIMFLPVALFVTWSIMEFSSWYMHSDPQLNKFMTYLLLFLITMMILTSANNMFQLFIGWEGVGIMSFLLISWWYGRPDANTAALQAIIYNRIGDIGFILAMACLLTNSNSWDLQQIFITNSHNNMLLPLTGLLIAATGKSAQFMLHPWLPSAMEGPTPVSALLHSSTMVVAGIFLMVRFHPISSNNQTIMTTMLCLGAITTLFSAICALTQNDIKKIVAFSTSSQLGLMMVTLGINQPYLAFLHICTHAFFKAMLFMCSGAIIHNLGDEQDIRKMGSLSKIMPFTSSCMMIGSLALTGMPFLTGFYSKDLIIEAANTCYTNAWALTTTLFATSLTAVYSMRIIYFSLMNKPRLTPLMYIKENTPQLINPIKRLAYGSILYGFIISHNLPITNIYVMTMPPYLKMTAILVTTMGLITALELNKLTNNLTYNKASSTEQFATSLGFYPPTMHRLIPKKLLSTSLNSASNLMDLIWLEKSVPKTISYMNFSSSKMLTNQKGLIKLYFLSFILTTICLLMLLMT
uniref:NADH dehydrogenase subunit 5 n=1 Tax=Holochilus sciureus TaxID=89098 RepID=UPI001FAEB137|nr:NADH dehydrogenase subunit 5 [Holochilus sciureus]ULD67430.1 NADH dehydrogenase subunit 5 [Holochilus sciureus]